MSPVGYNSIVCKHTGENEEWNAYVHTGAVEWQQTLFAWVLNNLRHPMIVVKYEDMIKDTSKELQRMLHFLQVPYSDAQFQSVVTRGYTEFKRPHHPHNDYDHYTSQQRAFVNSIIRTTHRLLEEYRLTNRCNVYEYLSPTH